jgi:uncharacterized protein (TIGR03437 family)
VLYGFEIGNEPDLYHSNGLRPSTYTVNDYITEWQSYADALQSKTPGAVLTASAASGSINTWTATVANKLGSRLAMLTQHLYALAPSSAVAPNAPNLATIPHILGATARTTEDNAASMVNAIAVGARLPWRMAETNSCYNGGEKGVSDVYASALWGIDYMFTLAQRSSTGLNLHGGGTGNYRPIAVSGSQITPRPLYYALLLFRAAARGWVAPPNVSAGAANVTAYATIDTDGTVRVVAINKDTTQDAALTISLGPGYTSALAMRLTGTAFDAVAGTTLGGAAVQGDGTWLPAQLESARITGSNYTTTLPSGSAILVAFGTDSLSASNAAGGQPEAAPDSFVSVYGQAFSMVNTAAPTPAFPSNLAGVTATVTDANGVSRPAALAFVSPSQVNLVIPADTAPGTATVRIGGAPMPIRISNVAPGLFDLNSRRVAAALAVRIGDGSNTQIPVFDCSSGTCRTAPIALDSQSTVYLSLYATGVRHGSGVTCSRLPTPALRAHIPDWIRSTSRCRPRCVESVRLT